MKIKFRIDDGPWVEVEVEPTERKIPPAVSPQFYRGFDRSWHCSSCPGATVLVTGLSNLACSGDPFTKNLELQCSRCRRTAKANSEVDGAAG